MHDCDPEIPSNLISEDLFFNFFPGGHAPKLPSISMLCMLIVLYTLTCIYDHTLITRYSLYIQLWSWVGLTTEILLPTAFTDTAFILWNCEYVASSCDL